MNRYCRCDRSLSYTLTFVACKSFSDSNIGHMLPNHSNTMLRVYQSPEQMDQGEHQAQSKKKGKEKKKVCRSHCGSIANATVSFSRCFHLQSLSYL